jgi:hypothetical protein
MGNETFTRRQFVGAGIGSGAVALQAAAAPDNFVRATIAQSDLVFDKPVARSEAGIPIGTGRMGTLVWTTPSELRMQINRVDVYGNNCATNSFIERNHDYCGGCAFVDIDCRDEVFPESGFRQHLSVYDGLLDIQGSGIRARAVAWPSDDVIAWEIDAPRAIDVRLRMLRPAMVQTRSHTATSRLHVTGARIGVTQEFREGDYCCKSAVVAAVTGRGARAEVANESDVRILASAGRTPCVVLIASAASLFEAEDVVASAMRSLEAGAAKGFAGLARETADWWRAFWAKGYVKLASPDGSAELVQQHYHYFLYLMGSSSRGKFPPKFNGMIWSTGGDLRTWGAQHWFANLSCYYEALPAANHLELMDSMFDMYSGAQAACEIAAQQEWGSQGAYIPETMYFDGLEKLPEDIAAEMRELYLLRKPWDQRSAKFIEYSEHRHPHSSRWNWIQKAAWIDGRLIDTERGFGPYGPVSHIMGTSAKVPYLYWRRYAYTADREWLKNRAYPMLKDAAEFYRNFPGLAKEADAQYHIHRVNSNESVWGARDTDEDLSALRGLLAAAIRASEILDADADLRAKWRELLDNLTPLATSDDADALKPEGYQGPRVWVRGRKPVVNQNGRGFLPDANSLPAWFFDLCGPDSADANNTLSAILRGEPGPETPVNLLSKVAIAAAIQGRSQAFRYLVVNQLRGRVNAVLPNRMSLREGPQALDAEALGRASDALQRALIDSAGPAIRLFPAWPREWDTEFRLLARGGFVVTASMKKGQVERVELESVAGGECVIEDPWRKGEILRLTTQKGQKISLPKRL